MAINKVILGNETKLDLSSDTVTEADVKSGKTFHLSTGESSVGTFTSQTKTVTSSRSTQTVTPDSGKYLSQVTVDKYPDASGIYTYPIDSKGNTYDMGITNNLRYVNAENVYNKGIADADAFTAILNITTPNSRLYGKTITITKVD